MQVQLYKKTIQAKLSTSGGAAVRKCSAKGDLKNAEKFTRKHYGDSPF